VGKSSEDEQRNSVFRSYVIDGAAVTPPLRHISDFVLLDGFYQPTLVVLHEPMPTWVGRHAVTRDTKALAQLSLNLAEQRHTVMWTMTQLPSDALSLFPIPRPLGGVLVFGANCLLRLNQATPPYGVSLNSHAHNWSASFPLREQPDCEPITLDRSVKVLLDADRLMLALADGKIYVLSLLSEGRTFLGFDFQRLASSVLPQCACSVGPGHVFLGSRMGDSQLLW
jgi:cleavage and polyadenylation specificity factor subunit 1